MQCNYIRMLLLTDVQWWWEGSAVCVISSTSVGFDSTPRYALDILRCFWMLHMTLSWSTSGHDCIWQMNVCLWKTRLINESEFKTQTYVQHMNRLINESQWELTHHSFYFPRLYEAAWCVEGQKQDMISKWQITSLTKMAIQSGSPLIWYS